VILDLIWFVLVAVLVAGYAVSRRALTWGSVSCTSWFRAPRRKRRLSLASVAPVWDGNEVWLLTAGGALFAAFPPVYATVFSGFLPGHDAGAVGADRPRGFHRGA